DDDDARASEGEVFGAGLGGDDGASEVVHPGEVGQVAVVVAVVAAAREEEPAGQPDRLAGVGALGGDVPAAVGARPVGGHDAVVEPDVAVDALVGRGGADVLQDRGPVRDG